MKMSLLPVFSLPSCRNEVNKYFFLCVCVMASWGCHVVLSWIIPLLCRLWKCLTNLWISESFCMAIRTPRLPNVFFWLAVFFSLVTIWARLLIVFEMLTIFEFPSFIGIIRTCFRCMLWVAFLISGVNVSPNLCFRYPFVTLASWIFFLCRFFVDAMWRPSYQSQYFIIFSFMSSLLEKWWSNAKNMIQRLNCWILRSWYLHRQVIVSVHVYFLHMHFSVVFRFLLYMLHSFPFYFCAFFVVILSLFQFLTCTLAFLDFWTQSSRHIAAHARSCRFASHSRWFEPCPENVSRYRSNSRILFWRGNQK